VGAGHYQSPPPSILRFRATCIELECAHQIDVVPSAWVTHVRGIILNGSAPPSIFRLCLNGKDPGNEVDG
jgi:hypothetical protein